MKVSKHWNIRRKKKHVQILHAKCLMVQPFLIILGFFHPRKATGWKYQLNTMGRDNYNLLLRTITCYGFALFHKKQA